MFALCPPEVQEPYAVVVLLEKDLIVVDLTQSRYDFHRLTYICHITLETVYMRERVKSSKMKNEGIKQ